MYGKCKTLQIFIKIWSGEYRIGVFSLYRIGFYVTLHFRDRRGAAQLCTFKEIAPKEPWEQKPYGASAKYNQGVNLFETRLSRRESFESREASDF